MKISCKFFLYLRPTALHLPNFSASILRPSCLHQRCGFFNQASFQERSFFSSNSLNSKKKKTNAPLPKFTTLEEYEDYLESVQQQAPTQQKKKSRLSSFSTFSTTSYIISLAIAMFGLAWASVPLYKLFCQTTGYGGTTQTTHGVSTPHQSKNNCKAAEKKSDQRLIEVDFVATVGGNLPWMFRPSQSKLLVAPGETALAFFTAKNLTDKPIIGMSVYNVLPPEVGIYFNKIQCFCFEEQLLNPHEEIDMPVLFFIDEEFFDDPRHRDLKNITLSYIFFESDSPIPEDYQNLPFANLKNEQSKMTEV